MTVLEYAYLGFFAGLTGIGLSLISGWALSIWFFEIIFFPDVIGLSITLAAVIFLSVLVGWLNTRDVVNSSPLEVLRKEV